MWGRVLYGIQWILFNEWPYASIYLLLSVYFPFVLWLSYKHWANEKVHKRRIVVRRMPLNSSRWLLLWIAVGLLSICWQLGKQHWEFFSSPKTDENLHKRLYSCREYPSIVHSLNTFQWIATDLSPSYALLYKYLLRPAIFFFFLFRHQCLATLKIKLCTDD